MPRDLTCKPRLFVDCRCLLAPFFSFLLFLAAGVPVQPLSAFLAELKPHLPWFQDQRRASGPSTVASNGATQRQFACATKTNDRSSTTSNITHRHQQQGEEGESGATAPAAGLAAANDLGLDDSDDEADVPSADAMEDAA